MRRVRAALARVGRGALVRTAVDGDALVRVERRDVERGLVALGVRDEVAGRRRRRRLVLERRLRLPAVLDGRSSGVGRVSDGLSDALAAAALVDDRDGDDAGDGGRGERAATDDHPAAAPRRPRSASLGERRPVGSRRTSPGPPSGPPCPKLMGASYSVGSGVMPARQTPPWGALKSTRQSGSFRRIRGSSREGRRPGRVSSTAGCDSAVSLRVNRPERRHLTSAKAPKAGGGLVAWSRAVYGPL